MRFFRKTDIIAIVSILAAAAAIWLIYSFTAADRPVRAEIYFYSELVETADLGTGQERVFPVPQDENVVLRIDTDGSIRFVESDCPDKICIKTGKLRLVGQSAACLPNGIVVKLVPADGWKGDEPDIIIGSSGNSDDEGR